MQPILSTSILCDNYLWFTLYRPLGTDALLGNCFNIKCLAENQRAYFSIFDGDGNSCLRGWIGTGWLLQGRRGRRGRCWNKLRGKGGMGISVVRVGMGTLQISVQCSSLAHKKLTRWMRYQRPIRMQPPRQSRSLLSNS